MAIATLLTRGFGNGTFSGTIPLVVTRGYAISAVSVVLVAGLPFRETDHLARFVEDEHLGRFTEEEVAGQ